MSDSHSEKILQFYASGHEATRLTTRSTGGLIERALIRRMFSGLPARSRILDVGGATGVHSAWLAEQGHDVVLVDPVPEQVAIAASVGTFEARVGDARALDFADASFDVVLLFGPLYHLPERADRLTSLREAGRVLRPDGILFAEGVSRLASFNDSALEKGGESTSVDDLNILRTGEWSNPGEGFPGGHFHTSSELAVEVTEAGFDDVNVCSVDMPTLAFELFPADDALADLCLAVLDRMAELDPDGTRRALTANLAPHLLATGRKGPGR